MWEWECEWEWDCTPEICTFLTPYSPNCPITGESEGDCGEPVSQGEENVGVGGRLHAQCLCSTQCAPMCSPCTVSACLLLVGWRGWKQEDSHVSILVCRRSRVVNHDS